MSKDENNRRGKRGTAAKYTHKRIRPGDIYNHSVRKKGNEAEDDLQMSYVFGTIVVTMLLSLSRGPDLPPPADLAIY